MANGDNGVMKSGTRRFGWRHLLVGLWLAACGGAIGSRTAGGESHFLRQCEDECGSGLECVSGVCTRGCLVGEDKCTDLALGAVCTDASIEPGALAVCDLSCESDRGCAALGEAFTCEGGFCRGTLLPGQSSGGSNSGGSNSGGSSSGSSGSGTGAVSTGGQPATGFYEVPNCSGLDRDGRPAMMAGGTPCPNGMACVLDSATSGGIPAGKCVGESAVGACAGSGECPEGFECTEAGDCSPRQANCWSTWTCPALPGPPCSYGYTYSSVPVFDGNGDGYCIGPCVPVTRCGCSNDDQCPVGAVCDTELGQCQQPLPWQPPNECALPLESTPCNSSQIVFSFVDGACQPQTCPGNANQFATLEECMAVCEGRPVPNPCPEGREQHITCLECLPADGCGEWATVCAEPCTTDDDCTTFGHVCQNGACGMFCN